MDMHAAYGDEGANRQTSMPFSWLLGADAPAAFVGGGGVTTGAFDIEGDKIVRCGLLFGRRWLECDDTELDVLSGDPEGVIYASVAHNGDRNTPVLTVKHGDNVPESALDVTNRPLYKATGAVSSRTWADLRSAITLVSMD